MNCSTKTDPGLPLEIQLLTKMFVSFPSYGKTWTRLAPHKEIIPLGAAGAFDSHTCYAAPPMLDPMDPKTTLLYYAGTHPCSPSLHAALRAAATTARLSPTGVANLARWTTRCATADTRRRRWSSLWRWKRTRPCQLYRAWFCPYRRARWSHAYRPRRYRRWLPPDRSYQDLWCVQLVLIKKVASHFCRIVMFSLLLSSQGS